MTIFIVIVDEEHREEKEKRITFLLKFLGKEIIDLRTAKLIMSFFLPNCFFIASDIVVPTPVLAVETVTGSLTTVGTEFIGSKCSEKIVGEKEEGEDDNR